MKYAQFIYTGPDVATYSLEAIESRIDSPEISLASGIVPLDRHMRPLLPGELTFVIGYTAHGKTSFLQHWTRRVVDELRSREATNQVAVYISYETMVEELGLYDLCSISVLPSSSVWYGYVRPEERAVLRDAAMVRSVMPLWVVGYSLKRRTDGALLTIPRITEALLEMERERGVKPVIAFVDFLQNITPSNPRDDRVTQTWRACDELKQMARSCGIPVVIACQAGREVMKREFKLPEIFDGQWASHIEQMSDKVIALWYPWLTEAPGKYLNEIRARVDQHLLVCGLRKQRHAPSGQIFPLWFDPSRNEIREWSNGETAAKTQANEHDETIDLDGFWTDKDLTK